MNRRERDDELLNIRSHIIEQEGEDAGCINRSNRPFLPNNLNNANYIGVVPDLINDDVNFSISGFRGDEPDTIDDLRRNNIGVLWQRGGASFEDAQYKTPPRLYNQHDTRTRARKPSPTYSDGDLVSRASCSHEAASSSCPVAVSLLHHETNNRNNTLKMWPVQFAPSFVPRDFQIIERYRDNRTDWESILNVMNCQGKTFPM
jgi:hypothetical protein